MRAAYLSGYGDQSVVAYGSLPEPAAQEHQVMVEVHAASINPVELAIRAGHYQQLMPLNFPHIPGFDISGVVLTAPAGSGFQRGDEVYARLPSHSAGAYAERVAIAPALLARKPAGLTHYEAASLPTVALTTWQALRERARLQPGERLLIQAGAGGVGSIAIQLAKYLGAHVSATAGSANQALLRQLGADQAIDYSSQRFEDFGPYDVVYDAVCGALTERGIASLAPGGRYVGLVGLSDTSALMSIGLPEAIARAAAAGVQRYVDQAAARDGEFHGPLTRPDGAQLAELAALVEAGRLKPVLDRIYPLDQLAAAYSALAGGHTRGKIVIDISGQSGQGHAQ
ncbi:zinc-binding dehydrogenase [Pseudoduganella sp. FT93W]|uniref:Zinc-binding dehydrogenase n=1 Tax=Duganella fentianensis TaxID=2692177 RepID=A0A845HSZ9_9BURK|nr:NADP-dependent oxidoreductase [Duganella fentianensis]MYN44123.1 zinc-binding dehydrogenase [Duganella fentianensis]